MASESLQICCINCGSSNINTINSTGRFCEACGTLQSKDEGILHSLEEQTGTFDGLNFCRQSCTQETRKYREFISKTLAVANVLRLPEEVIEQIKNIAGSIWNISHLKYRGYNSAKIATCIYCIIRNYSEITLSVRELAKACQTHVNAIRKCYNAVRLVMNLEPFSSFQIEDYIEKVAIFVSAKDSKTLVEYGLAIDELTRIRDEGGNRISASICLIITAASAMNIKHSTVRIAKHFGVHKQGVYVKSSATRSRLLEYSMKIPWRPPGLTVKNITVFIPEILRYYKEFGHHNAKDESEKEVNLAEKIRAASEEIHKEKYIEENGTDKQNEMTKMSKDPHVLLMKELIRKGCSVEELLNESLISLSKRYIDLMKDHDDEEISDGEIDGYLKSDDEINELTELKENQICLF